MKKKQETIFDILVEVEQPLGSIDNPRSLKNSCGNEQ